MFEALFARTGHDSGERKFGSATSFDDRLLENAEAIQPVRPGRVRSGSELKSHREGAISGADFNRSVASARAGSRENRRAQPAEAPSMLPIRETNQERKSARRVNPQLHPMP